MSCSSFKRNLRVIDLQPCGQELTSQLLPICLEADPDGSETYSHLLSNLVDTAYDALRADRRGALCWRRLYSEACFIWSILDCRSGAAHPEAFWLDAVARLDQAIVFAGAPGHGRLDAILDLIEHIQEVHLPLSAVLSGSLAEDRPSSASEEAVLPTASAPVMTLDRPPSLSAFQTAYSSQPFVIRGFASDWPAVAEGKWASKTYLQAIAGRGRIVPVEVGDDYREDDWTQKMMSWEEFLSTFDDEEAARPKTTVYLAQHDLFRQFPSLLGDVITPDYVYASIPEGNPGYRPPGCAEQLITNIWAGPGGTVSPAHTVSLSMPSSLIALLCFIQDPYYNLYGSC